ncbi:MAG: DNA polymerase III subunit gamma/tau [Chloroflexi bacterium]|nr:DNA polymerase III subunit gamma/tau [Chloroflexota bacterium]
MTDSAMPAFQALYNRYRPQRFGELVGQSHVVRILQNALAHNRLSHAYLFSGERGTGKTTAARLLAKAVNCREGVQPEPCAACDHCRDIAAGTFVDLLEMDAASHSSVDDVRLLREQTQFAPAGGRYKVYIIDEIHQLSASAKDALLKTLEEPPTRTLFVLATTEPHRVPLTIRSRCQHLTFRRIGTVELIDQLRSVAAAEGTTVDELALAVLARSAGGSLRDAISLLDQALAFAQETVTLDDVNGMLGLTGRAAVLALVEAIAAGDAAAGLGAIEQAMADGNSPGTLRAQVVDLLRDVLLLSAGAAEAGHVRDDPEVAALASRISIGQVVQALEVFAEPEPPSREAGDPILDLELAFARAVLRVHGDAVATAQPPPAPARPAPPPKDAQAEETPTAATSPDELTVETIKARASDWIGAVREASRTLAPYAEQGEVLALTDDVVTISYRSQLLLDQVDRPQSRQLMSEALTRTFGTPLRVRNRLEREAAAPRPKSPRSPASSDPVVRVAIRDYGAQPIDVELTEGA